MVADVTPDEVSLRIVQVLQEADLPCDDVGEGRFMTLLAGERKRTIGLLLEVGERTLSVRSQLVAQLDEGHRDVFELLLRRNERAKFVHFALDASGQVVLVGRVPLHAVTTELLGELLGDVLEMADSAFNEVLRRGFAGYLAHEQGWRRDVGLPPNPIGEGG